MFFVADRCIIFRCTIVHGCGAIVQCRLGNDWYRLSILPSAMAYPALPLSVCCLFRRNNKFVTFSFSSFSPIAERMVDTAVSVALIASLGLGILMHDDTKETQYWNLELGRSCGGGTKERQWKERNLLGNF